MQTELQGTIAGRACWCPAVGELSDSGSDRSGAIYRRRVSAAPPHSLHNAQCLRNHPRLLGLRHRAVSIIYQRLKCVASFDDVDSFVDKSVISGPRYLSRLCPSFQVLHRHYQSSEAKAFLLSLDTGRVDAVRVIRWFNSLHKIGPGSQHKSGYTFR